MDLDRFDLGRGCRKCGQTIADLPVGLFHRRGDGLVEYDEESDLVRRRCGECGYVWYEEPLDRQGV